MYNNKKQLQTNRFLLVIFGTPGNSWNRNNRFQEFPKALILAETVLQLGGPLEMVGMLNVYIYYTKELVPTDWLTVSSSPSRSHWSYDIFFSFINGCHRLLHIIPNSNSRNKFLNFLHAKHASNRHVYMVMDVCSIHTKKLLNWVLRKSQIGFLKTSEKFRD